RCGLHEGESASQNVSIAAILYMRTSLLSITASGGGGRLYKVCPCCTTSKEDYRVGDTSVTHCATQSLEKANFRAVSQYLAECCSADSNEWSERENQPPK